MKLNEMSTNEMAATLCYACPAMQRLIESPELQALLTDFSTKGDDRTLFDNASFLLKIFPLLLGKHFDDVVCILSLFTGKTEAAIRKQNVLVTMTDIKSLLNQDVKELFSTGAAPLHGTVQ